jgi:hypothetical protein
MARKMQPVTVLKQNNGLAPLSAAVGGSERDILAVLRRKLATLIDDSASIRPTALAALVKQLPDIDKEIRSIDARAAQVAVAEADDGDDGPAGWDQSSLGAASRSATLCRW